MGNFKLTTVEEFEAATEKLLETGKKVGADAWQYRAAKQTPHCKFGEQGVCCRICAMGPCRITPKAPRGICGCDVHGIVGRNYLKFTAGGAATHSDHGREICHTLYCAKPEGVGQDTVDRKVGVTSYRGSEMCVFLHSHRGRDFL